MVAGLPRGRRCAEPEGTCTIYELLDVSIPTRVTLVDDDRVLMLRGGVAVLVTPSGRTPLRQAR